MTILENTKNYPFIPNHLNIDGHNLAYIDEGNHDKPVVLMLHGNPSWSYLYRNLILNLKDKFRCIAPDHIGCGNSDKPQDYKYHLETHIANIEILIKRLNLKSFNLVVHDWGGAIGAGISIKYPEKVKSYTAMNTSAFLSSRIPVSINACRLPIIGEILIRQFNAFAAGATKMAVVNPLPNDISKEFIAPYYNWQSRIATYQFVADIPLHPDDYSYKLMQEIDKKFTLSTMPKQIIWGGKDFCFNDSFYETWIKRFPDAPNYYFENAGHYLMEDVGEEIYPLINQFITDINH